MTKISFVKNVVILVMAGYVAGCGHERVTLMVSVRDIGPQIVTKNKYTLGYWDGMHFTFPGVTLERLIAAQPQVFCSNGIPFTVKHGHGSSERGSGPFIVPVLIPFVIPGCQKGATSESNYIIDVMDCPDAHATFQKKERSDGCFAILSPLPMLFYPTAGSFDDEPEDKCKFTRHSYYLLGLHDGKSLGEGIVSVEESATAYGIAVTLKQMEESGKINPATTRTVVDVESQRAGLGGGYNFEVVDFHRTDSDSYRYVFSLVSTNKNVSLRESFAAKRVLSSTIRHDFMASYPSVNRTVLAVDFTEYEFANGEIKGSANVLPLNILAYNYDKHTHKGYMRIKVRTDQFKAARQYVRQNIESVVSDKNIALIVGETPPNARFELLDESVSDCVLEINFKAE